MRAFMAEHGFALERESPLAIANTARVLKLDRKGRLGRAATPPRSISRMSSRWENRWFAKGLVFTENF
jgi:hypothetical protein